MTAMQKLTREDLYSLEQYSDIRDEFRDKVLHHKRNRRVALGTVCGTLSRDVVIVTTARPVRSNAPNSVHPNRTRLCKPQRPC